MERVHRVIATVEPHDSIERYTGLGVEVLQGYARIVDPWTVEVAMHAVATAAYHPGDHHCRRCRARCPASAGHRGVGLSDQRHHVGAFVHYDEVPKRLVILGGGPIGCELAQSFARLGSQVTQVERAERLMVREDAEVSAWPGRLSKKTGCGPHRPWRRPLRAG